MQAAGFAEVWESDVEEDVNRVLFALMEGSRQTSVGLERQSARLAALARAGRASAAENSATSVSGNSKGPSAEVRDSSAVGNSGEPAPESRLESPAGIQEVSGAGEPCGSSAAIAAGKEHIFEVPEEVLAHMGSLKLLP